MTLSKVAAEKQARRVASIRLIREWQKLPTADGIGPAVMGDVARFEDKVQRVPAPSEDLSEPCWLWTATLMPNGYGQFGALLHGRRRMVYAHRVAYSWYKGPIPVGFEVDHLCFRPACVSPFHLEAVTPEENQRRATARITHCKHGHEFTHETTYRNSLGRRECRPCNARRSRELRARRAA